MCLLPLRRSPLRIGRSNSCPQVLSYAMHIDSTYFTELRWSPSAFNALTPNDPYRGRTSPLTSKLCILYIYSTNIGTKYFKHGIYSPFFLLKNAICFIILTYLVPVLFTFYIQDVLKLKKNNSGAKRLTI